MTHALQETTQTQVPAAQLAVPRADPPGREALDRLLQSLPRRLQDRIRLAQDQRILHFSEDIRGDPELAALLALLEDWYGTRPQAHAPSSFAQGLLAPQGASLKGEAAEASALPGQAGLAGMGGMPGMAGQPGQDETEVKRQLAQIIAQACAQNATDIHISDLGAYGLIRLRVMGEMRPLREIAGEEAGRLIAVAFNGLGQQSERPSFTSIERMDARIVDRRWLPAGVHAIRLHSEPVETAADRQGACLAMRILRPVCASTGLGLEGRLSLLGFTHVQCQAFRQLALGSGLVLVAGPTGHGKSTVLANVMEAIVEEHPEKACLAVEDPPEYPLRGVMQIQVATNLDARGARSAEGATAPGFRAQAYADAIAGAMQSDPDVLMIGEIRYPEAAQAAVDVALTGHAAWASVHARDAFAIPARLQLLLEGVLKEDPLALLSQPGLLAGLVCQRLVPRLCPACAVSARLADTSLLARALPSDLQARLRRAGIDPLGVRLRREGGCPACRGLGLAGSIACAEVVVIDEKLRTLLKKGRFADARSLWLARGGQTQLARALELVAAGEADPKLCEERLGQALDSEAEAIPRTGRAMVAPAGLDTETGAEQGEGSEAGAVAEQAGYGGAMDGNREAMPSAPDLPDSPDCAASTGRSGGPGKPAGPPALQTLRGARAPAEHSAPPGLEELAGWNGLDGLDEPDSFEGRSWLT